MLKNKKKGEFSYSPSFASISIAQQSLIKEQCKMKHRLLYFAALGAAVKT
jgi:hypothetical protein